MESNCSMKMEVSADTGGSTCTQEAEDLPLMPEKPMRTEHGSIQLADGKEHEEESAAWNVASLSQHFGYKLLLMLFAAQHLMKGFSAAFTNPAVSYLFAAYQVRGPHMQIFGSVTSLPWAMKPVIGLMSDAFPIMGYNKAPYVLAAAVMGCSACAAIALSPQSGMSITQLVSALFLVQLMLSTCDLLTEAKYSEKMRAKPKHGPALMTFVWFGLTLGGLVAVVFVGPVMQRFGPKAPYLVTLLPMSFIFIPTLLNYLEEEPKTQKEEEIARARIFKEKETVALCLLMFAGTIALSVTGILSQSPKLNASVAMTIGLVMLVAFSITLNPTIAKVNAFFLMQMSLTVSISGAAFYFYTDKPEAYPDGPHFSMQFFTSVLGVISSLCSLVGIWTYHRYASKWTYRGLMFSVNVVNSLLNVTDLILFTRLNKAWGIPDHAFVLGASVFGSVVNQWMWMPAVVIMAQLCPKGMEATMYALLAGCHNLGTAIASSCGAFVLETLGCQPSGALNEGAQFKNLWVASAISTVLPLITLALIPWLIPDARQTEKILKDDDRDATSGSLLRKWTGRS